MEIWKDIEGYEGLYQASTLGRIKSLNHNKGRILKPYLRPNGYYYFVLSLNGKTKPYACHQLIAMAFLDHKNQGLKDTVDHISGEKLDNRLVNLRIISHRENSAGIRSKTSKYQGVCWVSSKSKWKARIGINGKYKFLGYFDNEEEAAQVYQNALEALNQID